MTWWIVWLVVIAIAVTLGFVGAWFSLKTLRWFTGAVAVAVVIAVTRYGLTHTAHAPSDLTDSFLRGVNEVIIALLHPLWRTHSVPAPGNTDRWIIAAALLLGYRQLEAWTLRWQAPELDMSAIEQGQPDVPLEKPSATAPGHRAGQPADGLTDAQRHAELAAELRFRLPAMEIRSPAILPGGTRTNALASIAESSGVSGAGIVSAAFQLAGMFWPSQGQIRARVWMEPASAGAGCRVTALLDNARTGMTVATKTVTGSDLQEAASMVAGYIARQFFDMDRSVPVWCYGVADGRDLGAMQLARMERVYAESADDLTRSRERQIEILRNATGSVRSAGVVRYELAQLCALAGQHAESLYLHAVNRELYPRLYRGRYRFAMTLEMITCPEHYLTDATDTAERFRQMLDILSRCRLTGDMPAVVAEYVALDEARQAVTRLSGGEELCLRLSPAVCERLLDVAAEELRQVRKQLTLWRVVRDALFRRDERPVWMPHWQQRHRETFQDGVAVAELFIAVRRKLLARDHPPAAGRPGRRGGNRSLRDAVKIASFIAGDEKYLSALLALPPSGPLPVPGTAGRARSGAAKDRVRRLPWQRRTASWQAAYNTACLYAALAAHPLQPDVATLEEWVIGSLRRAVDNPSSELERPSDWISQDPDFRPLCADPVKYRAFAGFLTELKRQDYPAGKQRESALAARPAPGPGSGGVPADSLPHQTAPLVPGHAPAPGGVAGL